MTSSDNEGDDAPNENMKVFCRLRPMNKLEMSRRSKNCVDLPDDDPQCLTIDSPLEGEYDFFFDHVFEEYASQDEVYESSIAPVPEKLLEGYNCSVIAYGQTGSGKTHTMMGQNGGADGLLALTQQPENGQPRRINPEAQGMILRTAHDIFQQIQQTPANMEFTIRCSYVEIYLEKILDLLNPGGDEKLRIVETLAGDEAAGVGENASAGGVAISGAAELCCFDEADVYGLLARGNACRTMSSTEMNTDSSRSHAIFIMKVEQHDKKTGTITTSELHMVDLAGSEMASSQNAAVAQRDASAVQMEAKMINKSLTVLQNCIRAQLENQEGASHSITKMCKQSNITRFLRPSFGGNCKTWLILTASPSSYNIGETISTVKFGKRVGKIKNHAVVNADFSREVYRKRFKESEQERKDQMAVLRAIARECKNLKEDAREGSFDEGDHDGPLWDTIEELLAADGDSDGEVDFKTLIQGRMNSSDGTSLDSPINEENELEKARLEIEQLREELESISKARDESESQLTELQSEVAVLRSQNEHLISDKTKDLEELINAKNELQIMSQRKIEVEHNFRTSQFRENEAIVFLRTFRRFYKNVLRDRAAQGSGSISAITKEISDKVPGAISLDELVDADRLLLEAGLIEEHEMRDEKSAPVYVPSKDALIRSATAAKKASKELGALEKKLEKEKAKEQRRQSVEREDSASNFTAPAAPGRAAVSRRGSAIRRSSFASLDQAIANDEEDATNADTIETNEEPDIIARGATKLPGAGADAGAGSSQPAGKSGGDAAAALLLWDQSGAAITKRQQLLGTPAGRFSIMHDKKLNEEFEDMADQCIKLERALKEERATVEMLSGRAGGVNKKKLAQEAIQLRQQIEKKTNNLMAIAWKMNELNLINKSYNEKMVNREQHVVYLEENYVELQNRNRMIIEEQQEAERKLREEFNSVQKVLGGMSVSLWQYKEEKLSEERPLTSRIHVPVLGGSQIDDAPRERRLSDAESEPSVDELHFEREREQVDASTQTDQVEKEDTGAQTDEVLHEDVGTMTEESLGIAILAGPSTDSEDASVQTENLETEDKDSTVNNVATASAVGAAAGGAAAAASSNDLAQSEESASGEDTDDMSKNRSASEVLRAAAGTAAVVSIPTGTQVDDDSSVEESDNEDETDFAGKLAVGDASAAAGAVLSRADEDVRSEQSYDTESDGGTGDASVSSEETSVSAKSASSQEDDGDQSEESEVRSRQGEIVGDLTSSDGSSTGGAAHTEQADTRQSESVASDDDIEALTKELASDGAVPRKISISSNPADDDGANDKEEANDIKPPWKTGKVAPAGITGAAVVAAAASITREEEEERNESEPLVSDNGKTKESAPEKAKNIFASAVMSVLNIGGNDAASKEEEVETDEMEIESYHGDGHTPNTNFRGEKEELAASSRDEWAAARDDFDSIFEETAQAVSSSSSRRRPIPEDDPEKSTREFMDMAAKIGHRGEDEVVTMGSKGKVWSDEKYAVEDTRKPWEKGHSAVSRKPWEKAARRGKDDGSMGSFDATKDDWYGGEGSDYESDESYQFETHVLNRPKKREEPTPDTAVKFSNSAVKPSSTSDDEFDKMMNATQAALGVAEDDVDSDREEENEPENGAVSLTSREEAMFIGGRSNDFQPRRQAKRPKIRAGVLKEEKKSSRDKGRSQLLRKKSESRRRVGDDNSKKRKKKDEKKKKKSSSKSTRDLARAKSERYPRNGSKKGRELTRSPRRQSAG